MIRLFIIPYDRESMPAFTETANIAVEYEGRYQGAIARKRGISRVPAGFVFLSEENAQRFQEYVQTLKNSTR